MVNLQLSKIGPSEISVVRALAEKIWRKHYPEVIGMEQVEFMLGKFYNEESMRLQMLEGHRKGLGRRSFELLLKSLGDSVKAIRLQVNRQNYKPINFYFKMGFVIERVADFDIGDGYFMNDFVMVWHAK